MHFRSHLRDHATVWYRNYARNNLTARIAFERTFFTLTYRSDMHLRNLTQRSGENRRSNFYSVLALCDKIGERMTNEEEHKEYVEIGMPCSAPKA